MNLMRFLPDPWIAALRERFGDRYATLSYAQEGEDLIIDRFFGGRNEGFYVDVGAFHPRRYSNTHVLFRRGWRGINIEPNPDGHRLFVRERRGDVNLALGIADRDGALTYFRFNEPALNTFDEALARERDTGKPYRMIGKDTVPVRRLGDVLAEYLPAGRQIDFLTVDAEGFDLQVLHSNDWSRFRPVMVILESLHATLEGLAGLPVYTFMHSRDYTLYAKTCHSLFFTARG